eukprot:g2269.t1
MLRTRLQVCLLLLEGESSLAHLLLQRTGNAEPAPTVEQSPIQLSEGKRQMLEQQYKKDIEAVVKKAADFNLQPVVDAPEQENLPGQLLVQLRDEGEVHAQTLLVVRPVSNSNQGVGTPGEEDASHGVEVDQRFALEPVSVGGGSPQHAGVYTATELVAKIKEGAAQTLAWIPDHVVRAPLAGNDETAAGLLDVYVVGGGSGGLSGAASKPYACKLDTYPITVEEWKEEEGGENDRTTVCKDDRAVSDPALKKEEEQDEQVLEDAANDAAADSTAGKRRSRFRGVFSRLFGRKKKNAEKPPPGAPLGLFPVQKAATLAPVSSDKVKA